MKFLSLFSGIEAASVAWLPLGWQCVGVAEIESFPCAVLKHHYPDVPNLGDVTKITREQIEALGPIDLVCGGFPCQDLSVAGKRAGLKHSDGSNTRSGLFFDAMRIVEWARPRWVVIENVPGLFSSNRGRDFASVVGEMAGCEFDIPRDGWRNAGVAVGPSGLVEWQTLDAQYVRVQSHPRAVPQRRRRVFVVRHSGDWRSRPPLFLVPESLSGHPAPSRKAGQGTSSGAARSLAIRGRDGVPQAELGDDCANALVTPSGGRGGIGVGAILAPESAHSLRAQAQAQASHRADSETYIPVSMCLNAKGGAGRLDAESETLIPTNGGGFDVAHALRADGFDASEDGTGRRAPLVPVAFQTRGSSLDTNGEISGTLGTGGGQASGCAPMIAFDCKASGRNGFGVGEIASTQRSMSHADSHTNGGGHQAVMTGMQVRRLTPLETERLQGFPDGYTAIPVKGKPAADGPRYKSHGNSWAINCVRWIGERIEAVEAICAEARRAA